MWMLAILFPYIALLKLRRYTEATIIALIWLFGMLLCITFFPFAFVIWPAVGALLSLTSIIAGLYTSQYYAVQRNDKLIDAITSAALLLSDKEAVARPTFTPLPQVTGIRTPAHPSPIAQQLYPQWTRIQKVVIIAISTSVLLAGTGAYAYDKTVECVRSEIEGFTTLREHTTEEPTPRICYIIIPIAEKLWQYR